MALSYFREQKHYTLSEIQKRLGVSEESCKHLLGILKKYGVVKSVDSGKPEFEDLSDLDVILSDVTDDSHVAYKFGYVGVVLVESSVFCCYPKYIDSKEVPEPELKQILEVIRKYDSNEQLIHLYNGIDESKVFNKLAVSLYLLRDYYENGIYTNQEEIIETNGEGEINWDKTINETFAIIKNKTPYYVELQTINTQSNDQDYFTLLHQCILTLCSEELSKGGLLSLFNIQPVELSGNSLDDFGDADYIKYRLEVEIQKQFVTKKQILLKTLYTLISEMKSTETANSFSLYGTNAFYLVWEKACSEIFENIKDKTFRELKKKYPSIFNKDKIPNPNYDLDLDNPGREFLDDSKQFKDFIEQIKWIYNDRAIKAAETLEPDIISIFRNRFFILDAKYYFICIDDSGIHKQPGIQDVVKQFAYHRAFSGFIKEYKLKSVNNAFFILKKSSDISKEIFHIVGKAELSLMQDYAFKSLAPIQIVELTPEFVYENYLKSKKCTEELSDLINIEYDQDAENLTLKIADNQMGANRTDVKQNNDSNATDEKSYDTKHYALQK